MIRGGQIRPPSFLDDLLSIPFKIYNFFMLFVQTLYNVRGTTAPRHTPGQPNQLTPAALV